MNTGKKTKMECLQWTSWNNEPAQAWTHLPSPTRCFHPLLSEFLCFQFRYDELRWISSQWLDKTYFLLEFGQVFFMDWLSMCSNETLKDVRYRNEKDSYEQVNTSNLQIFYPIAYRQYNETSLHEKWKIKITCLTLVLHASFWINNI